MSECNPRKSVLSGMRPTGKLHLGHYHGAIKNWLKLQNTYESYFFVADWHALTTHYATTRNIAHDAREMVIDWLACGIDPDLAHIFIQSRVPEHAELHLFLSMITPLSWLERVPTYKDQLQKLKDRDLTTYGFLGYPVLMASDILIYKTSLVPVGEDQGPHVEIVREIARRFNHFYGKGEDYEKNVQTAIKKFSKQDAKTFNALVKSFQEKGEEGALQRGCDLVTNHPNLSSSDKENLSGYLEGKGRVILLEPELLLTEFPILPGLDGQKMSKSYHNTIGLREDPIEVEKKIKTMPTDPARVRRTDPGDPDKCPVWKLHQVYSNDEVKAWVQTGCRSAGIGCLDCKKPLIDCVLKEQAPIRERAEAFSNNPTLVDKIIDEGCEVARAKASQTIKEVREVIGLS